MSDYVVRARFVVKDDSGDGMKSAGDKVEGLRSSIFDLGSTVTRVLGALGVSVGLGTLARGIISLNGGLQEANAGMATLLSANYGMEGIEALKLARGIVGDLRKDAAVGVGELSDYMGGLQTIMGPGLRTGASLQQLRELTRNMLTAGNALRGQEGMGLAAFDVQQALMGQVGDRTTPIVMQALGAAGITADAFRKLRPEERIGTLNSAFGVFAEGAKLMGQTWGAQMSTFQDQLKELARTATSPLFDRWSEQLKRANEWLAKNQDRLEAIAGKIGDKLVALWDHLVERAGTYATLVGAAGTAPMFRGAGAGLMAGTAAGAGMLERGRLGLAKFLFPAQTAYFMGGGGMSGAGAGASALFGSLGQLLSKLAWPLAIVTTAFLAIKGALTEFQGPTLFLLAQWEHLMNGLTLLGDSFGMLTAKGSVLNLVGAGLVGLAGILVWVLDKGVRIIGVFVAGLGVFFRLIGENMRRLATGEWAGANAANMAILRGGQMQIAALMAKNAALDAIKPKPEEPLGTPDAYGGNNTIINGDVNVHQTVNTRMGHREIAGAFDLLIERTNRYRRQAVRRPAPAW